MMSVVSQTFGTADQAVFLTSMAAGGLIGIYFAYFTPKPNRKDADYLFGERKMKMMPVALSLAARYVFSNISLTASLLAAQVLISYSAVSGIAMVGLTAEVYLYGMQYAYVHLFVWLATILYNTQFLPVFYRQQGLSINEVNKLRDFILYRLILNTFHLYSILKNALTRD